MLRKWTGAAASALLLATAPAFAHGDVRDQIEALTRTLKAAPRSAELHVRRGELHRVLGETGRALADFRAAARLDPSLEAVDLCAARALLEAGRARDAGPYVSRALARHPGDPEALLLSARVHAATGDVARAADLHLRALEAAPRTTPDLWVETARALTRCGRAEEALETLERGLAALGSPVSLEESALDLELSLGRTGAALLRVGRLAAGASRPETWLVRRAEILERSGLRLEARDAFAAALLALESLPARARGNPATTALEETACAGLSRTRTS